MRYHKTFTFLFFYFMFSFVILAQEKHLKTKKVAKEIRNYIAKNFAKASKIKYYQDKINDTILIEADFKYQKENYSLLFLPNGILIEQEIEIEFEDLPSNTQVNIKKYLNENFTKFRILKSQKIIMQNAGAFFELKIKQKSNYYELFFDKEGSFSKYKQIIFSPINTQF